MKTKRILTVLSILFLFASCKRKEVIKPCPTPTTTAEICIEAEGRVTHYINVLPGSDTVYTTGSQCYLYTFRKPSYFKWVFETKDSANGSIYIPEVGKYYTDTTTFNSIYFNIWQ